MIPSVQVGILKYHLLQKESKFLKRNGHSSCGAENVQVSLEYLAIADNEEAIQDYWSIELPYGPAILLLGIYVIKRNQDMFTQKVLHKCS